MTSEGVKTEANLATVFSSHIENLIYTQPESAFKTEVIKGCFLKISFIYLFMCICIRPVAVESRRGCQILGARATGVCTIFSLLLSSTVQTPIRMIA